VDLVKEEDDLDGDAGSDMVKISEKLPTIHKKFWESAECSEVPQKYVKNILKGLLTNEERSKMSGTGSKVNPSIDKLIPGYPKIREGLKGLADTKFRAKYPMTLVSAWINSSAGDARKQLKIKEALSEEHLERPKKKS